MKITESQLRKIISEAIMEAIGGAYTMDDWAADGSFNANEGQEVDIEVVRQMRDCVPPETMTRDCLQVGEAFDHDWNTGKALYTTFERHDGRWFFTGYKPSMSIGWK